LDFGNNFKYTLNKTNFKFKKARIIKENNEITVQICCVDNEQIPIFVYNKLIFNNFAYQII